MSTEAITVVPWSTIPVHDHSAPQPAYLDLPLVHGLRCPWSYWGSNDQLGTINRLTGPVVAAAAQLVTDGLSVNLSLPIQIPAKPSFHRCTPVVTIKAKYGENVPVRDEEIAMNDQSGTQWDGLRHFGCMAGNCFYQGVKGEEVQAGALDVSDPLKINPDELKNGIHHWASHGITGRGVLLDLVSYYLSLSPTQTLPYDPCTTHAISLVDIKACAKAQGVEFLKGDILILRVGWTRRYYASTAEEKEGWGRGGEEHFAGVENTEEMKAWIWENQFAAVASDQPAFESWPPKAGEVHLHQTVIAMFGSPIGEFFDCEELSKVCKEKKRYTFFFVSNPLNILGGVASTANASAIF